MPANDSPSRRDDGGAPQRTVPEHDERRRDGNDHSERERRGDPQEERRRRGRTLVAGIAGIVLLIVGAAYGWHWYRVGRFMIETDDAYTQADNVTINPQVAGYVSALAVTDNQQVRAGDVIVRIDDRTFRAQVDQAEADLATAVANVANVDAQITLEQATVVQAESGVSAAQAATTFAQQEMERYGKLAQTGVGSVQRQQQTESSAREQQADLVKAQAALTSEIRRLAVLQTQKQQAEASVLRARAALEQARINLGYTAIAAPVDGVVGDRSVRLGQYVEPSTRLLTLVPMQDIYIVANYKETQLDRMHQGQPVEISVDAFSGETAHGRVDSFAPGSGSQFALLPPENATGNFTKIVQRVPVKILIDRDDPLLGRLRPGLSVIPTVDTRDTRGKKLAERPPQVGLPPPQPSVAAPP
jgi:membrane fusion protein, multidrug efflux system